MGERTHRTNSMCTIHTRVAMHHTAYHPFMRMMCRRGRERAAAWLPFALAAQLREPESTEVRPFTTLSPALCGVHHVSKSLS